MTAIFPKSRAPFFQFLKKGKGDDPLPPLITRMLWNPFDEFEGLIKVFWCQGLAGRAYKFIRKETPTQCFPVNFAKFLKTRFLLNISGRLLLFDPVSAFRIRIFPRSFRYKILRILKNHQRNKTLVCSCTQSI